MTITKMELSWLLDLAKKSRDSSAELAQKCPTPFNSLQQLRFENMAQLADKLETALKTGAKRISIKQ